VDKVDILSRLDLVINNELLLSLVLKEKVPRPLGVRLDVEAELHQDSKPNIVGSDDEMMVVAVGFHHSVENPVPVRLSCGWHT